MAAGALVLAIASAAPINEGDVLLISRPLTAPPFHLPDERELLEQRLRALAMQFPGDVGIAVRRLDADWTVSINGDKPMPQQSVSKLWVSMAILAAADRGELSLDEQVTIRKEDLSIFHQPIRRFVGESGYSASLRSLMEGALQQSDNAANDALVKRLGGPFAVQVAIVGRNLDGIRYGPGERAMQTAAAGLSWKPAYSFDRTFWEEREALPAARRKAALDAYLADPPDAATPVGIVEALSRLRRGELLSAKSTTQMLGVMEGSITGGGRLRAGLPAGWKVAHKTGTGQVMGSLATGYNDVGLITAPDGRVYAVAVMVGATRQPLKARQAFMVAVARAVAGEDPGAAPDGTAETEAD
ncbi:serine hydrolase [Caulobacter sp. NIBR1757]|uniref:serine hydrolase n=1 Tax=Caulobacter sp. NIBR1757 TaxID=3016000 RepID=UPI0022F08F28|nr:serine hydrolase [Caulobacter sp. NIBR1757]WGM39165.1 Extended-spectrum beta-lactamase PER-1 [Caulobacter sp. NIBR1757]